MQGSENNKQGNEDDLKSVIFKETVDYLYRLLPSSVIATIIISGVLVAVLWQVIDQQILLTWFLIMLVINIGRYFLYRSYERTEISQRNLKSWDNSFYFLLILTGLTWSAVSIILLPDDDSIYHYFPDLILIGVCAGAVTSLSFSLRDIITYFTLLLLPMLVSELIKGSFISNSVAALTIVFVIFAFSNARRIYYTTIENISLRYESEKNKKILTESKNAAIEASTAKTDFLSTISHELRTPLNAVLGFAQLLKMSDSPHLNEEQDDQVQGIIDSGQHLLSLIEELLDVSKIGTHKIGFDINIEDVSINVSLDETISILSPLANKYGIDIKNEITNYYWVKADRKRLKQIFINLISNALKYNHHNGTVSIEESYVPGNRVRFSVTDTGDGLTKEQQAGLFQAFKRFDTEKEGMGLGLYITRNLVEIMGGSIGVESEVGKGSSFWFEMPLTDNKDL